MADPRKQALDAPKRDRILDAALGLFAARGFHGTAVPRIAEEAGVAAGTIYRYFRNKEALVNAVYRRCKSRMMDRILDAFPFQAPPREQFHLFWSRLAEFARVEPMAFDFLELHHHGPYLDPTSRALETVYLRPIWDLIEANQRGGRLRGLDPAALMAMIWGAITGLIKAERLGYLKVSDGMIAQVEESLWAAVDRRVAGAKKRRRTKRTRR